MSRSSHEPLSDIRTDARTLTEASRDHQTKIDALAAVADRDKVAAELELLDAFELTSVPVDRYRSMLRLQLERSVDRVESAQQLLAGAREQHVAAARLLSRLDREPGSPSQPIVPHGAEPAVLVVDDYADSRALMSAMLESAGFVVRTAANGLEALLIAHEMRPAVIVMDVTMPVLDGLQATRLIKATNVTRHARVIAYTGNPAFDDHLVGDLFVAVLPKPSPLEVVVQTVRAAASL